MDLPWKAHGMPWRPKSGFGHDPKKLSLPSILCSKGCHYQFLATEMDFGAWCLVCHLPELEYELQLGPLRIIRQPTLRILRPIEEDEKEMWIETHPSSSVCVRRLQIHEEF